MSLCPSESKRSKSSYFLYINNSSQLALFSRNVGLDKLNFLVIKILFSLSAYLSYSDHFSAKPIQSGFVVVFEP